MINKNLEVKLKSFKGAREIICNGLSYYVKSNMPEREIQDYLKGLNGSYLRSLQNMKTKIDIW